VATSFLKRLFASQLGVDWEYAPGDVIWKLSPARDGILVGESRDVDKRRMSLFALRTHDGSPVFSDVRLDEPWWIALEMTIGDLAILHRYPKPDLPNALGATIVDCRSGQVLWEDRSIRVICGVDDVALAQRGVAPDRPELLFIDLRTGSVLEELGSDVERAQEFHAISESSAQFDGWTASSPLIDGHPRFEELTTIVKRERGEGRGAVELAEHGDFTVLGMHERSRSSIQTGMQELVDAIIVVLQGDRVVYKERVTIDAPGASEDIFFIWRGRLIFIRDRRTLVGIDLERR